jgi:hypothetical protein
MPISALCQRYSITKDQPLRQRDPTAREIAQACREIQARWDAHTRHERQVTKPTSFEVREVELPPDLRTFGEGE